MPRLAIRPAQNPRLALPVALLSSPPHTRWLDRQALGWLPALVVAGWRSTQGALPTWAWWALLGLLALSFTWLWRAIGVQGRPADRVTAVRFAGLLGAVGWVAVQQRLGMGVWILLLVVVLSDLLDGYVARRTGPTEAGALLDMETDQFTTLVLALFGVGFGGSGPWLLLLPGLKYAYVLGLRWSGRANHEAKPRGNNQRGRVICATVLGVLLATCAPWPPQALKDVAAAGALLLLTFSFGSDALYLLRNGTR